MPESAPTKRQDQRAVSVECEALGIRYRQYHRKPLTLKEAVVNLFRTTSFEHFWALQDVELRVHRGESLGVIGANGSGKSTLLKAICGVLPPTTGDVRAHGKIVPLLELGGGFNPELTGRENIYLNAAILGTPRREVDEKIDGIIDFSGLREFIDIPLHNYSSGMKSRLGFAVATDIDPEILLLDEILAVGDAEFQRKAMERTENFFRGDRTVVLVSHSMSQVKRLCTRVVWLEKGRIRAEGKPTEVIREYLEASNAK